LRPMVDYLCGRSSIAPIENCVAEAECVPPICWKQYAANKSGGIWDCQG